jgi:uncharacterized C2H2 Zn-finger protein
LGHRLADKFLGYVLILATIVKNGNKGPDLNGNSSNFRQNAKKRKNGVAATIKDQVVTSDGRVFYPCQYCNKVFPIKKSRTFHIKKCPAKEYILTVGDSPEVNEDKWEKSGVKDEESRKKGVVERPEVNGGNVEKEIEVNGESSSEEIKEISVEKAAECDIPVAKKQSSKIDIQQNIVLNKQMNVEEILSKSQSPPIKLTIRRSASNGSEVSNHFTVCNSLILKEKNESNDVFDSIAKRLKSNSVTITKQPKKEEVEETVAPEKTESTETVCKQCRQEFASPLELLRHSRNCHSYPKILMAMSEVKKFYSAEDRSECPICHKPLKTNFRSAFVKHLHTHTNEMKYSCNVCNRKFRRSDHMKAHEKRHVVEEEK